MEAHSLLPLLDAEFMPLALPAPIPSAFLSVSPGLFIRENVSAWCMRVLCGQRGGRKGVLERERERERERDDLFLMQERAEEQSSLHAEAAVTAAAAAAA